MKCSDLIKQLNDAMKEYGDLPVVHSDDGMIFELNKVHGMSKDEDDNNCILIW